MKNRAIIINNKVFIDFTSALYPFNRPSSDFLLPPEQAGVSI